MFFIKKLKSCFHQGENNKRAKVMRAIMEAVHEEYTEDNYISRISWLVEEILLNDKEFRRTVRSLDHVECLKKAIGNSIDEIFQGK